MIKTLIITENDETNTVNIKMCVSLAIEESGICKLLTFPFDKLSFKENESIFHVPLKLLKEDFDRLSSIYKNNKTLTTEEIKERNKVAKMFFKKALKENEEEIIKYYSMTPAEKLSHDLSMPESAKSAVAMTPEEKKEFDNMLGKKNRR